MRTKLSGWLFSALLAAACAGTTAPSPSPSPSTAPGEPGATVGTGPQSSEASGAGGGGGGAGQTPDAGGGTGPGAGGGTGVAGGGGGGSTLTHTWSETVEVSDAGVHSLIHQEYEAIVSLSLSGEDGAWTLTGTANITSLYTSEYKARMANILGAPCDVHYTDSANASGTVQVDGGLEARDGFYQFYVNIPGIDTGTNATVRDDSDCDGSNSSETTPWPVAPDFTGGSGEYSGTSISGTESDPREGGQDTTTWSFTLPS